jgi:NAD-specific glutamate dehydrogenase
VAFAKYVDSVLDVLLPNSEVVDRLGQREILFFGPDENTSDFMVSAGGGGGGWVACVRVE